MSRFKTTSILTFALTLVGLTVLLSVSQSAQAGVWVQGGFSMIQSTTTQSGSSTTGLRLLGTGTLGYQFIQGFLVGGQALYSKDTGSNINTWTLGPKGGFQYGGLELTAAFLPYASDTNGSVNMTGNGFAINLGYTWKVTGPLRLGFYVMYWTVTYTQSNGVEMLVKTSINYISPQLAIVFSF